MRDITHKQINLRSAKAMGVIFCTPETIELIKTDALPKGNLFDVARAAGFIGAKLTPQLLPHCHPVQIDGMDMSFEFLDKQTHSEHFEDGVFARSGIVVLGNAKSIGRTGIEMEMLTAVSVACLEIYDMLKPVDKQLEIGHIKLLQKRGGKSDRDRFTETTPTCAVLVCSDSTAGGTREDKSGKLTIEMLKAAKADVIDYKIVPDDKEQIKQQIATWVSQDVHFIFTTGGTGLGPRDNTVYAVKEILDYEAEGIAEAMRGYGQQRTPLAMMSRGVAGVIAQTVLVTLPGSTGGVKESLEGILPGVFHARKMILGEGH
jgi:molybdenum cofactor biosynthesis protein MoaC